VSGDIAIMELRVRDVFGPGVALGPYSRFGWSHPGPLLYWTVAPLYEALRGASRALPIMAGSINLASGIAVSIILRRVLGPLFALSALPLVLLVAGLGPHHWTSLWNPDIPIMPLALFVTVMWQSTLEQRPSQPFVAIVVGSFIVQSHVGFMLPVISVAAVAVVLRRLASTHTHTH